jgi:hypothetical protein
MITMTGKLLNIVQGQQTNKDTGEVTATYTAEVLRLSRGKSVIDNLKLDVSVVPQWKKAVGFDFFIEVRSYSMANGKGGVIAGYALANKTDLPTSVHSNQLKAA